MLRQCPSIWTFFEGIPFRSCEYIDEKMFSHNFTDVLNVQR